MKNFMANLAVITMVGFVILAPTIIIGIKCMTEFGTWEGFFAWPISLVLVWMLAKGMADNMCR